jgi:hypothetical protein
LEWLFFDALVLFAFIAGRRSVVKRRSNVLPFRPPSASVSLRDRLFRR